MAVSTACVVGVVVVGSGVAGPAGCVVTTSEMPVPGGRVFGHGVAERLAQPNPIEPVASGFVASHGVVVGIEQGNPVSVTRCGVVADGVAVRVRLRLAPGGTTGRGDVDSIGAVAGHHIVADLVVGRTRQVDSVRESSW